MSEEKGSSPLGGFSLGGRIEGEPLIAPPLHPSQCVIKMVDDTLQCIRGLGPHHPKHDPSAPIGATRRMLEKAIQFNTSEEKKHG